MRMYVSLSPALRLSRPLALSLSRSLSSPPLSLCNMRRHTRTVQRRMQSEALDMQEYEEDAHEGYKTVSMLSVSNGLSSQSPARV